MRTFSTAVQGELNKRFAGEPLVIVEIEWADGAPVAYTDRKLNGEDYPHPFIISMGNFATTTVVSGAADSQNVTITMNDIDGSLKNILETQDIHLNKVSVYLGFQGLPATEKALMFEGVINSPITWDEGSRTLSFDVFSKLEDAEAGFTMDDGDFPFIPASDRNKPWPLVFGEVCNMEAVRVTAVRKGFLGTGQGVMDPTIDERLCQAYKLQCPTTTVAMTKTEDPDVINPDPDNVINPGSVTTEESRNPRVGQEDQQCLNRRFAEICAILNEQAQQSQYVSNPITIRGGTENFPQNELIKIKIGEVFFDGVMNGDTFTITQTYHPDLEEIDNPPCMDISEAATGYRFRAGNVLPQNTTSCDQGGSAFKKNMVGGSGESWNYYNTFEKSRFIWLPPGTEVFLAEEAEVLHIVSLIPGTVNQVAAYRTYGDTALLTEVDPSRYTVHTTDFGGYECVEVRLNAPLSTIQDESWDDEIYVSFTSDVGPNPVDVIEWLVEKYTEYTVDATNFAAVKAYMTNYPTNFFVKSRPSVLKLIRDIAYQSRMAVLIRNNVVSLVYLSLEPTSLKTITNSSILPNTFRVTHSETEDLATRHEIKWSDGEAGVNKEDPTEFTFVLKHNVPKYGTIKKDQDYYTQNTYSTIEKSATFWMIRTANTWKYIEFETPMLHLDLDVFDCFTINVPSFPVVKCVVTSSEYNADNNTIKFKAWTPVLAGENAEHFWAWPSQKAANAVFPLLSQTNVSGDGMGFSVIPPEGHPLRGGYDPELARRATDGDRYPSDLDDTFPELTCKIATGAEIADAVEPVFDDFEPLAEQNFADRMDEVESGQVSGGSEDEEEPEACGMPTIGGGCVYEVNVIYITPDLVTSVQSPPGGGCNNAGPCTRGSQPGRPCTGAQYSMCHSFGAIWAATMFKGSKDAEAAQLYNNCQYQHGVTAVLGTGGITSIPGEGAFGECQEYLDLEIPPNGEEIKSPGCASGDCP